MSLSASDLQKRHDLEGAPDPFPSLDTKDKPKANGNFRSGQSRRSGFRQQSSLDTTSEASFPSLTPLPSSSGRSTPVSGWSDVGRVKRAAVKTFAVTESFSLGDIDLKTSGKDGRQTTLTEVIKTVKAKTNLVIEASSQSSTGQTTFLVKGDWEDDVFKAKKLLIAMLSPTATQKIDAPISTIGFIIGPKGVTLKQIREEYQVRVDIPSRKDEGLPNSEASTNLNADEEDEPTSLITVSGPAPLVQEAVTHLRSIIAAKAKKSTRRMKDISAHVFPFLATSLPDIEAKTLESHPEALISISPNYTSKDITLFGDKIPIQQAMEHIEQEIQKWKSELTTVTVAIPRPRHRFIFGGDGPQEIFDSCQVVVLQPEQGDGLVLWGKGDALGGALSAVLQKANSKHVATIDLPGKLEEAKQIHTYMARTSYLRNLGSSHPEVTVYVTPEDDMENLGKIALDFVGDENHVKPAVKEVQELVKKLDGAVKIVEVNWLVHNVLIGKHGKKINQFQEAHNVIVFFPPEASESSTATLIHDPLSSTGSITRAEKKAHLEDVSKEILKMAAEAADVKTETINVDKKWHAAVVGKNGTTLNAVIGEEKSLSIKVGSQAKLGVGKEPLPENVILIRGPRNEVERAIKEIQQIVKNAENDEIENSFSIEFDIPRDFVGRIVGTHGSGVNKIRDALGVRVDFNDEADDKEWSEKGKGKKVSRRAKVKITGRRENAEEAKKRILEQVDKYADETVEVIRVERQYHPSLIGSGGKYVIRLEEKYGVKIIFGRETDDAQNGGRGRDLKPDEVMIKGGKKGVAGTKAELLEAVEYEIQSNLSLSFNVPTRSISRIVGKGGSSINEIKENTGAQIDVERDEGATGTSMITVRGDDRSTKDAKAAIMAIVNEFGEEVDETIYIEARYHRNFIGKGGETLREIITKVGGPSDPKQQVGLVHFPRPGEAPDEVKLHGDKVLVSKLKEELENMAATFRDRVVLGIAVPAAQHRTLIGRGGQHLNDLQNRTGTQIWFPGSRAYGSVGDPDNTDQLREVVPEDLVKVFGPRAACEVAIAELSKPIQRLPKPAAAAAQESVTRTMSVPLKYHNVINQQGNFYRTIRSLGVFVDHSNAPEESFTPTRPLPSTVARIDEAENEASETGVEWQVISNYQGAEEGDADWILRGRDEESLDAAQRVLQAAIDHAEGASHVGFLTLADRSAFPRIVGSKGANVSRIRAETGADVTVGRNDNTIIIVGSEDAIELAKAAILQTVNGGGRGRS